MSMMIWKTIKKINRKSKLFIAFTILLLLYCGSNAILAEDINIVLNPGFENVTGSNAENWVQNPWDKSENASIYTVDEDQKHSGNVSMHIINNALNDTRAEQKVMVDSNSLYKLSCWILTNNVGYDQKGATLSVSGILDTSVDIRGTNGKWEYVELYGKTNTNQDNFIVTVGIGGYSSTNTGEAWFDDISVQKIEKLPDGVNAANLYVDNSTANSQSVDNNTANSQSQEAKNKTYGMGMIYYTFFYILLILMLYVMSVKKIIQIPFVNSKLPIILLLAVGLIFRIILAQRVEGFPNDIACFKAWALAAAKDLPGLYKSDMFLDYPPLYMYVLFIVGKLASIPSLAPHFTLLIKMPPMLADIAISYFVYLLAEKKLKKGFGFIFAAAFVFSPAVLLNSALWGMVDSFFMLLVLAAILLLVCDKIDYSVIFFAASVLMKPQGIFFLPLLLFALIKKKDLKVILYTFIYGLSTVVAIILPFSFGQSPFWIFELYLNTASGYTAASLNAYNLFSLFGANLKQDSSILLLFSYSSWGLIFDLLLVVFAGYIYLKLKDNFAPVFTALILNSGAFVLSTRMHERYMYPVVILSLLCIIYMKDKRLPIIFSAMTVTVFLNMHDVLYRMLSTGSPHIPADNSILIIGSAANVFIFAYMVKFTLDWLRNEEPGTIPDKYRIIF